MKTIIGRKYIARDNSYSLNLTYQKRDYHLAGTFNENPKEALIVSEPYKQTIESWDIKKELEFINVEYEGDTIRVMYFESAVDDDLQERILKNHNRHYFL